MNRRLAAAGLAAAVAVVHLWVADDVLEDQLGSGAAVRTPPRIEVVFVRELQQQAPARLAAPAAPAAAPARRRAMPAALPASAAASAAALAASLDPIPVVAALPPLLPPPAMPEAPKVDTAVEPAVAAASAAAAQAASQAAATADAVPAFEWPPSTRLSYRLTGNYRGPVEGSARVEWVREGSRYQVRLEVFVGPSFAPLVTRRMTSDGDITAEGLRPRRYDEETRVPLRGPRALTMFFDEARVRLPSGTEVPRPAGVQDTASQFVQMTWLFTLTPSRLETGRSFVMPLALPRRVEDWTYDIVARETLDTPAGEVATFHVKPRREPRPGSDLTAEMWIAPSLQYLPVRIIIRQDSETYADLLIERLPQQAAPALPASSATGR